MVNPRQLLIAVRASYWFVPALLVLGCATLALGLVELDARLPEHMLERMPRLFGAGAEGSRALLSAIATSTMTVAGVVFSINIVALSLATAQYSPHVLQNFMRDRANQAVLGLFLGIYTYCLIVLRTIRGGDESFIPGASIVAGILLALLGVFFLIFFIHHVSMSIQVSNIVSHIAAETRAVIARSHPAPRAGMHAVEGTEPADGGDALRHRGAPGYIEHIDYEALADIAAGHGGFAGVPVAVGDFVLTGQVLAVLHGGRLHGDGVHERVRGAYAIGQTRNIDQDAAFGLQQLVDIACRALSASNNDATTALHALDHLTVLLAMLAGRDLDAGRTVRRDGRVVLACARPGFDDYLRLVATPFRRQARVAPEVFGRLVSALERVGLATRDATQLEAVLAQLRALAQTLREAQFTRTDVSMFQSRLSATTRALRALAKERRGAGAPG